MRHTPKLLLVACLLALFANCQSETVFADEAKILQSYTVTIIELHVKTEDNLTLSHDTISKDFEKLATDGNIQLIETVSLSVLEKHQTNVQFGRTVALTMGVTQTQFGKTRNTTQIPLGTLVKVTAEPLGDKVLLKIDYKASRIVGEIPEDQAADVEQVNIDTSILLNLGQRVTIAGDSLEHSKYLMVTVTQ